MNKRRKRTRGSSVGNCRCAAMSFNEILRLRLAAAVKKVLVNLTLSFRFEHNLTHYLGLLRELDGRGTQELEVRECFPPLERPPTLR